MRVSSNDGPFVSPSSQRYDVAIFVMYREEDGWGGEETCEEIFYLRETKDVEDETKSDFRIVDRKTRIDMDFENPFEQSIAALYGPEHIGNLKALPEDQLNVQAVRAARAEFERHCFIIGDYAYTISVTDNRGKAADAILEPCYIQIKGPRRLTVRTYRASEVDKLNKIEYICDVRLYWNYTRMWMPHRYLSAQAGLNAWEENQRLPVNTIMLSKYRGAWQVAP